MSAIVAQDLGIAHGFGYFDGLRCWALRIAESRGSTICRSSKLPSNCTMLAWPTLLNAGSMLRRALRWLYSF